MERSSSKESKREGSSSFLKKRTKKLLLSTVSIDLAWRITQQNKSFLVLFFKKKLRPWLVLLENAGFFPPGR
jgi:hypothetical protein